MLYDLNTCLNFGKQAGSTVKEVIDAGDEGYVMWLIDNTDRFEPSPAVIDYLNAGGSELKANFTFKQIVGALQDSGVEVSLNACKTAFPQLAWEVGAAGCNKPETIAADYLADTPVKDVISLICNIHPELTGYFKKQDSITSIHGIADRIKKFDPKKVLEAVAVLNPDWYIHVGDNAKDVQ